MFLFVLKGIMTSLLFANLRGSSCIFFTASNYIRIGEESKQLIFKALM